MTRLVLDPEKSSVRVRTFAEGLFARFAHDLELVCRSLSGTAERSEDGSGSAEVNVPIMKLDVSGTLKDGRLDPKGLSESDIRDCLAKMRKDVFHLDGEDAVVHVEATLDNGHDRGRPPSEGREAGKARIRIVPPNGRAHEQSIDVRIGPEGATATRLSGSFEMSLRAIGSDKVKGPMNAFRMKDEIEILFDVVFDEAR